MKHLVFLTLLFLVNFTTKNDQEEIQNESTFISLDNKEFLGTNYLRGKPAEYFAGSILTPEAEPSGNSLIKINAPPPEVWGNWLQKVKELSETE